MARGTVIHKPASSNAIRAQAMRLAYLGSPDKVLAALANEFGADRKMPSRAAIQNLIDMRKPSWTGSESAPR